MPSKNACIHSRESTAPPPNIHVHIRFVRGDTQVVRIGEMYDWVLHFHDFPGPLRLAVIIHRMYIF